MTDVTCTEIPSTSVPPALVQLTLTMDQAEAAFLFAVAGASPYKGPLTNVYDALKDYRDEPLYLWVHKYLSQGFSAGGDQSWETVIRKCRERKGIPC